jgi:hypothetical protein
LFVISINFRFRKIKGLSSVLSKFFEKAYFARESYTTVEAGVGEAKFYFPQKLFFCG